MLEGEVVRLRLQAQLARGYPQTVGDLCLTDRRVVLIPNQVLSIGFGKRWEVRISDIRYLHTKRPFEGDSFIGGAGNSLEIVLRNNTKHVFTALQDVGPMCQALSQSMKRQDILEEIDSPSIPYSSPPPPDGAYAAATAPKALPQPGLVMPSNPPKDPVLAAFLSFMLAGGGGQIYIGQVKKGVGIIIVSLVLSCVGIGLITWLLGVVDAYVIANRLKSGVPVGEMQMF